MLINWFTIIAQVINFLILIFLLRLFLYKPILNAIDAREKKIKARLDDAQKREDDAKAKEEEYEKKLAGVDSERDAMLSKAKQEVEGKRKEMLKEAQADVARKSSQWNEALQRDKESFLREFRQRVLGQSLSISRKALADLSGSGLEEVIIGNFFEGLNSLSDDDKKALLGSLDGKAETITVGSAFDLKDEYKNRIWEAVKGQLGDGVKLEYQKSDSVIGGIEMRSSGHKVAWSIASYLDTLDEELQGLFQKTAVETGQGKSETGSEEGNNTNSG